MAVGPELCPGSDPRFQFGPFRLEVRVRRLLLGESALLLTPKAFDLLVVLVRHAGRVLRRREINDTLWPNVAVCEGNLKQRVWSLRKVLTDGGASAYCVEAVPRVGYCLTAAVRSRRRAIPAARRSMCSPSGCRGRPCCAARPRSRHS
jgi:DNA-binding winged helix-turn-helix (wHTH) protein